MHTYHLFHIGDKRVVSSNTRGVEINTRSDFPWFSVDFFGEVGISKVNDSLKDGERLISAFYGDCYFDRDGRRYNAKYTQQDHDCFVAYIEYNRVYAVLDESGWPLTANFATLKPDELPRSDIDTGYSNVVRPFRQGAIISEESQLP